MPMFRKKPVLIEAHRFDGSTTSRVALQRWMAGEPYVQPGLRTSDVRNLEITTLEGVVKASPGDWIIKGVQGEFYPCKPLIFIETYEEAK